MNKTFSPKLVDLYCDLAAHLLTLEFVQSMPVWQQWLAERVLTGLPNAAAYRHIFRDRIALCDNKFEGILGGISWMDTDAQNPSDFLWAMQEVAAELRRKDLPPFPREHELDSEVEHKLL